MFFNFALIIKIIFLIFGNSLMVYMFLNAGDLVTRIVMLPFLVCLVTYLLEVIFMLFKNDNAIKVCR